jgi:O-antigen/teichoic acid export membrane protein
VVSENAPAARAGLGRLLTQTFVFSIALVLLNFATGVLTARLLAPAGRGVVGALLMWTQTLAWLGSFGLSEAGIFLVSRRPEVGPRLLGNSFVIAAVFGTLTIALAQWGLPYGFAAQAPDDIWIARLFLFTIYLEILWEMCRSLVAGNQDFVFMNALRVTQPLLKVVGFCVLWTLGIGTVTNVLLVCAGTMALIWLAALRRLIRRVGIGLPSVRLLREGLAYGIRQQGSSFGKLGNERLDVMLMPAILAPAPIGLYSVATNLSLVISYLIGSFHLVVFPAAARAGQAEGLAMVASALRVVLVAGVLLAVCLCLIAPYLIGFAYGHAFLGAVLPFRILLVGAPMMAGNSIILSGLRAIGKPLLASMAQIIGFVVTAVGLYFTLARYGIVGAAWTSAAAYTVSFLVALIALGCEKEFSLRSVLSPRAFANDVIAFIASLGRFIGRGMGPQTAI